MTPKLRAAAVSAVFFAALLAVVVPDSALAAQAGAGGAKAAPSPQGAKVPPATQPVRTEVASPFSDDDAERTRERLRTILRQYPPSLADVLRLDSSLLTNDAYLASYPDLGAYLAQHPDIAHNPAFFVGPSRSEWQQPSLTQPSVRAVENMFDSLMVLTGLVTLMGLVGWALKTLVEHRRWLRLSKIQTEAHGKVLDRLTSNEDLLAYMQTPAGRRFLESSSIQLDGPRSMGAPVGRILFSAQAGIIISFVGIGLRYVSARMAANPNVSDAAPFLLMVGVVTIAVGMGFLLSSGIAYLLSRHLGLLEVPTSSHA